MIAEEGFVNKTSHILIEQEKITEKLFLELMMTQLFSNMGHPEISLIKFSISWKETLLRSKVLSDGRSTEQRYIFATRILVNFKTTSVLQQKRVVGIKKTSNKCRLRYSISHCFAALIHLFNEKHSALGSLRS
jgi:DNA-binding XRE family transcriptional regulator